MNFKMVNDPIIVFREFADQKFVEEIMEGVWMDPNPLCEFLRKLKALDLSIVIFNFTDSLKG